MVMLGEGRPRGMMLFQMKREMSNFSYPGCESIFRQLGSQVLVAPALQKALDSPHNPKADKSSWLEHCFLVATSSGFPPTPQSTELGAGTHRTGVWGCLGTTRLTTLHALSAPAPKAPTQAPRGGRRVFGDSSKPPCDRRVWG